MKKLLVLGLGVITVAVLFAPATVAQTNANDHHNGVEYFFFNPIVPPTNATTATRNYGSASTSGAPSGAFEGNVHGQGVQQDGFVAWNGQAGPGGSNSRPIGFSLMQFRNGGSYKQGTGTIAATASWSTSLPCAAPWFWIVTFTWGTTYTTTSTANAGSLVGAENFFFSLRGDTGQAVNNQNYFTGSGNERNLNTGGISYLEDTIVVTSFQLVGAQEWSSGHFTLDGVTEVGRDPSGTTAGFGLDYGTGGKTLRTSSTTINPGSPADGVSFRHRANQEIGAGSQEIVTTLVGAPAGGPPFGAYGLNPNGGGFGFGAGRTTNLIGDPVTTGIGLAIGFAVKSGTGTFGTGDVAISGVGTTLNLQLNVTVPAALQPLTVHSQSVGLITVAAVKQFGIITTGDDSSVN